MVFVAVALAVFAAYFSVLYYGHKIVPNSDFSSFFRIGKEIIHFQAPSSYKRLPVTGMLQYVTSFFMTDPYPDLKAGWMVSAIIYPLMAVLLLLVGNEILGKAGKWFALLVIVNPFLLAHLVEPIAEIPLLFFILLTTWLIFKRSKWCYLAAMVATMVRYEAVMLVVAAFVIDMIYSNSKKQRFWAVLLSALALVPIGLWMYGTITTGTKGTKHYFSVFSFSMSKEYREMDEDRTGILKHCNIIWYVGFSPLFNAPPGTDNQAYNDSMRKLGNINKFFAAATFIVGLVFAAIRKNWKILVLLIFLIPYVIAHALYPYPIPRFHTTSFGIVLLISFYGIVELWRFADKDNRIPRPAVVVLQFITISVFGIWLAKLLSAQAPAQTLIGYANQFSPTSGSVIYIMLGVVLAFAVLPVVLMRFKGAVGALAIISVFCVIAISNQFAIARRLGSGMHEAEFKQLADWYVENAAPGERLATTLSSVVRIYVPVKADIYNYRYLKSKDSMDFAVKLNERNVRYVAWDSRLGLAPKDPVRKIDHLDNIKTLMNPKTQGPFKYIKTFQSGRRFINLFELQQPP